jgi:hypothetical protein
MFGFYSTVGYVFACECNSRLFMGIKHAVTPAGCKYFLFKSVYVLAILSTWVS